MGDVEAMAAAIESMLENPERSREMGRAGRQRVIDHFTIEQTVRKVESIYELFLKAPGHSSLPMTVTAP
jgi:glycosyltransferase involved in cell wall biosynthesis